MQSKCSNKLFSIQGDIHSTLEEINMAFNHIGNLQTHTFVDLTSLTSINLEDNRIDRIERRAFMNMNRLKYINLRGNKIKDMTDEAFQVILKKYNERISAKNNVKFYLRICRTWNFLIWRTTISTSLILHHSIKSVHWHLSKSTSVIMKSRGFGSTVQASLLLPAVSFFQLIPEILQHFYIRLVSWNNQFFVTRKVLKFICYYVYRTEISMINYFCNSITHNSQTWLELVIEIKWILNLIRTFNWIKVNY